MTTGISVRDEVDFYINVSGSPICDLGRWFPESHPIFKMQLNIVAAWCCQGYLSKDACCFGGSKAPLFPDSGRMATTVACVPFFQLDSAHTVELHSHVGGASLVL